MASDRSSSGPFASSHLALARSFSSGTARSSGACDRNSATVSLGTGRGASQPRSAHELGRARLDVPGRDTMQRNLGCWEMTTEQLVKSKRDEILRVAAQHGARNVRVFGSVARGEADEASDVDFLVDMEPGRSLLDLGSLQVDFESLLGRRVDVVTVRGLKARIRNAVLAEAVPV